MQDLKKFVNNILTQAKKFVVKDGSLVPCAMFLEQDFDLTVAPLPNISSFEDEMKCIKALKNMALISDSIALLLVRSAKYYDIATKDMAKFEAAKTEAQLRKIKHKKGLCIYIHCAGPGIAPFSVQVKYKFDMKKKKIVFDKPSWAGLDKNTVLEGALATLLTFNSPEERSIKVQ